MTEFNPLEPKIRRTYLGASDIPAVMGVSPWKTTLELWEEKVGISSKDEDNHHMKRGRDFEPVARRLFESEMNGVFEPCFKRDDKVEWMAANLDGYDMYLHALVEIKCPSEKVFDEIVLKDEIPLMYQYQICWQKHVSKAKSCYFFAYDKETERTYTKEFIEPEGMFEHIFDEASYFWECVTTGNPPEGAERNYPKYESESLIEQASRLIEIQDQIRNLEKEAKDLKKNLILAVGQESANIGSYVLERSYRKGSIEYGAIPALKKVNLEDYRKSPVVVWKIK